MTKNELHHTTNNNRHDFLKGQPTKSFVLLRNHQTHIVARNSLFIIDDMKDLRFVGNGLYKYWLNQTKKNADPHNYGL